MSSERVVLITGCSTGIGLSTAVLLAHHKEQKFKVYATMRNLAKKDDLIQKAGDCVNKTLFVLQLDVCSESSVNDAVKEILDKEKRIDVLVNNAGVGLGGALEHQSMETIVNVYDINVHGVIRAIRAVLPSMKKQKSGHIINVSSVAGLRGVPFNAVYSSSKFAVEGLSESLAPELAQFNIKVTLIDPGPVPTSFTDSVKAKGVAGMQDGDDTTKDLMQRMFKGLFRRFANRSQSSDEIAEYILRALKAEKPHLRYVTNQSYEEELKAKYVDITGDALLKHTIEQSFTN